MTDDDKSHVDQAVELMVYAPLGFALEARRLLPSFVDRGRQQVMVAKMVGQFAVKEGQKAARSRLAKAQVQTEALLTEFGLGAPDGNGDRPPEPAPAPDTEPAPAPAAEPARARSGAGADDLAIADYDSLAASQVIPRLAGLGPNELDAVRAYESSHRARKTILGKIAQLQGA